MYIYSDFGHIGCLETEWLLLYCWKEQLMTWDLKATSIYRRNRWAVRIRHWCKNKENKTLARRINEHRVHYKSRQFHPKFASTLNIFEFVSLTRNTTGSLLLYMTKWNSADALNRIDVVKFRNGLTCYARVIPFHSTLLMFILSRLTNIVEQVTLAVYVGK